MFRKRPNASNEVSFKDSLKGSTFEERMILEEGTVPGRVPAISGCPVRVVDHLHPVGIASYCVEQATLSGFLTRFG